MTEKFQPPRGTRDFLPKDMAKRRWIFEKIRNVFESYGYGEVSTPAFEDFRLLARKSGPEIEKEIYAFKDKSGRRLGLRFDPTVPICRIVASDPSLTKPVKFYYITNMWRYDRPSMARWREFWQAGVELIGSEKPEADAEILAIVNDSLKAIDLRNFTFLVNSRKIIEALAKLAGIPRNKRLDAFRAIDKLDKIGVKEVSKEMERYGISRKAIDEFIGYTRLKSERLKTVLRKEKKDLKSLKGLEDIIILAKRFGVRNISMDLSIVRGIDYYTGFVFETLVKGHENLGSVASGGRYDELISIYGGGKQPATGFGIGIDRLSEVVNIKKKYSPAKVFVVTFGGLKNQAIKITQKLRSQGIPAQMDLMGRGLRKQLEFVNASKIPYVLFVGKKELKSRTFTLRDMKSGKEIKTKLDKLANLISKEK